MNIKEYLSLTITVCNIIIIMRTYYLNQFGIPIYYNKHCKKKTLSTYELKIFHGKGIYILFIKYVHINQNIIIIYIVYLPSDDHFECKMYSRITRIVILYCV